MELVPLAEPIGQPMMAGEETLWEGRPSWRAWGSETIWGWILAPLLIGIFFLVRVSVRKRSHWWKLTTRRLESETGIVSKKIDTLELWRIKDVEFRQTAMDRMLGVSRLVVTASDPAAPVTTILGLPPERALYDRFMSAVMASRAQRGILNVNS